MPTGVALHDAREQLFAAAERLLVRDGPSALTSRSITAEAGVAKGVLHRHFDDFDDFVVQLVQRRILLTTSIGVSLEQTAGTATVVHNLVGALTRIFHPVTLALVSMITARDGLRARLRAVTPIGVPILAEAASVISSYLLAEQFAGRIRADADPGALAFTIIGTAHLLFAGELGGLPDDSAVEEIVAHAIVGAEPGVAP
jgi:AcrR family transcriptional regulator